MVDQDETTQNNDEPILCVTYATFLGWFWAIFWILLALSCFYFQDVVIARGRYYSAFMGIIGGTIVLPFGLEILLTKHILFYEDRLVKVWHFLGEKTIPYTRAMLMPGGQPSRCPNWLTRDAKGLKRQIRLMGYWYSVKEVDDSGKPPFFQIPFYYISGCVSRESAKKVDAIIAYLVGTENTAKIWAERLLFVKSTLPKQVVQGHVPPL